MTKITTDSVMQDIFMAPELQEYSRWLMYGPAPAEGEQGAQMAMAPLKALQAIGWSPEGICAGVNFLIQEQESGRADSCFIYDEAAAAEDPQKRDVNLIRLRPEKCDASRPYILLAAGGGYNTVCTLVESLPTARHFVEAGYTVFLLTYRVMTPLAAPKALEDLCEAVSYIRKHAAELGVPGDRYAVGGFSAGANLISNFGVPALGYGAHNLPRPLMLMPVYTFIDLKGELVVNGFGDITKLMFGDDSDAWIDRFNIAQQIDSAYPPCYIVCGKNDQTVPCTQSELMKALLERAGVRAVLEEGENAPHGFGDGTGTDVEGWPLRAMKFLQELEQ